ncbi:MAG: response regulator [Anaerolineae bacterium]|nr:response regulator [Anaerolineae bacterium]
MSNETILVVDDSAEIVRVLKEYMLTPLGYQVISAADGRSGLKLAVSRQPDLILLDMQLPFMDGLEVLKSLRQAGCQAPVIFMTMHGSESTVVEVFRLGVRDYLAKPFTVEDVQQAVDRALQESRLVREREELTRNLIASETVRQTAVTLSHYINNHLMVLSGNLALLQEALRKELPQQAALAKMVRDSQDSADLIAAVMRVLQQTTDAQPTTYLGQTRMIDIETALRKEVARIKAQKGK